MTNVHHSHTKWGVIWGGAVGKRGKMRKTSARAGLVKTSCEGIAPLPHEMGGNFREGCSWIWGGSKNTIFAIDRALLEGGVKMDIAAL